MKPIIRKKGKLSDGRSRYVIEYMEDGKKKCIAVPKPEDLLDTLKRTQKNS